MLFIIHLLAIPFFLNMDTFVLIVHSKDKELLSTLVYLVTQYWNASFNERAFHGLVIISDKINSQTIKVWVSKAN